MGCRVRSRRRILFKSRTTASVAAVPRFADAAFATTTNLVYRGHRIATNAGCNLIPVLRNHRDVCIAVTNILRASRGGILSDDDVTTMLYGLQIARSLLPKPRRQRSRTVQTPSS